MQYVCDASDGKTWFRLETEAEAVAESDLMKHAVEKYFRREQEKALTAWQPAAASSIERDIGKSAHVAKAMPLFLTLRDREGAPLVTGMLPPEGQADPTFRIIIVGPSTVHPTPAQAQA